MKKLRILGIFLVILSVLAFSVPVGAASQVLSDQSYTITSGIEIFPGINICGNKFGATFVAQTTGGGTLRASVNYYGTSPVPPTTYVFGGNWTLKITEGSKTGTLIGLVSNGTVEWSTVNGNPTGSGAVNLNLKIIGGTGDFYGVKGSGTFSGDDVHESGKYILGVQVPTVDGTLTLYY